jgi:hypothetical protein
VTFPFVKVARTEEDRLRRPCYATHLEEPAACVVGGDECPVPERDSFRSSQPVVRHLEHDAAHVLVGEEVVAGELELVQRSLGIEEKRVAAPTGEEPVLPALRHPRVRAGRDGRALHDDIADVSDAGCVGALDAANRRGLRAVAPEKRIRKATSATPSPFVSTLSS